MSEDRPGYTDTPMLPDGEYRVHDVERPHPPTVTPDGPTTTAPPSDATVLFDGTDLDAWESVDGGPAGWHVEDGTMVVEPGAGDVRTRESIGDCQLHVEWATPPREAGSGRWRGNSGVFLMDRYEIQVLDCYEETIYADGYTGAVYGQRPPLVNACLPPEEWQSFDIVWRGPRFDGDDLDRPARVTVLHNGVVVQDAAEPFGPTAHRSDPEYSPHPPEEPLRLQDHDDPVRFRNLWYRPL